MPSSVNWLCIRPERQETVPSSNCSKGSTVDTIKTSTLSTFEAALLPVITDHQRTSYNQYNLSYGEHIQNLHTPNSLSIYFAETKGSLYGTGIILRPPIWKADLSVNVLQRVRFRTVILKNLIAKRWKKSCNLYHLLGNYYSTYEEYVRIQTHWNKAKFGNV